jgi:hypothetical protein
MLFMGKRVVTTCNQWLTLQNYPVPESETSQDTTIANQHQVNTQTKGLHPYHPYSTWLILHFYFNTIKFYQFLPILLLLHILMNLI